MLISEAWAQTGGGGSGDFLVQLFPLILIFVVFYFLLIRPQQAKVKAQREMLSGVKRGDRVVTGGHYKLQPNATVSFTQPAAIASKGAT